MTPDELVSLVSKLAAAGPNVAVVIDAAKLLFPAPQPDPGPGPNPDPTPSPTPKPRFVVATDKASGRVKVRPEASVASGGPTIANGTIVEDLKRDATANGLAWKYIQTLDGIIKGYVEAENLKPA